jgi:Tol biopolymer transport system component
LLLGVTALSRAESQSPSATAQSVGGRVLGVARGQVSWIDLLAPRPMPLTSFVRPDYPTDVAAVGGVPFAVASVARPIAGAGSTGADLVTIDLQTSATRTLLARNSETESLDHPSLWPDGSSVVFQRSDLRSTVGVPGQAAPQYRSRIEQVHADGTQIQVLVDGASFPDVSRDGSAIAFTRSADQTVGLWIRTFADGGEVSIVPSGSMVALAYPRFSPDGRRVAFSAISVYLRYGDRSPATLAAMLLPLTAWAHGYPWETWLVNADGSELRQIPDLYDDDSSVAWSPDGNQLLVYGGWGSFLVNVTTGETQSIPYAVGYGSVGWLPE